MKIWRLECSHGGDPPYIWALFKNKPPVEALLEVFRGYSDNPTLRDLDQLINQGYVMIKYSDFYLEELEVIEND